jgi:23S rRNA (cytosine1962-C5)-methyltransferase
MLLLTPQHWKDYELIDCGAFEKLERFGQFVLSRPEPQAVWNKKLSEVEWEKCYDAKYIREKGKSEIQSNADKGNWIRKKNMPENWFVSYQYKEMNLMLRLALTSFGHIGIFPEQAENWDYIYDCLSPLKMQKPKVLNLFAYTGGASLAACSAGAEVVHVDSVKQAVNWSNQNKEASGLDGIRWVVEDALKFARREARRGNKYQGIIMDPPAYGRGPEGEKWVLEYGINELIKLSSELLLPAKSFFIINLYSMGLSALVIQNLISNYFPKKANETGELFIPSKTGYQLPLGTFLRFKT